MSKQFIPEDASKAFNTELEYAREELADLLVRVSRRSLPLSMPKDAVVSYGEQLSSRLLAEGLKSKGITARQVCSRRLRGNADDDGAGTRRLVATEKH